MNLSFKRGRQKVQNRLVEQYPHIFINSTISIGDRVKTIKGNVEGIVDRIGALLSDKKQTSTDNPNDVIHLKGTGRETYFVKELKRV